MSQPQPSDDEGTGLPILGSWPAVYTFVVACFLLYTVALTLLSHLTP